MIAAEDISQATPERIGQVEKALNRNKRNARYLDIAQSKESIRLYIGFTQVFLLVPIATQ